MPASDRAPQCVRTYAVGCVYASIVLIPILGCAYMYITDRAQFFERDTVFLLLSICNYGIKLFAPVLVLFTAFQFAKQERRVQRVRGMLCSECMYHLKRADPSRPDALLVCPECGHRTTVNRLRFVWGLFLRGMPPEVPGESSSDAGEADVGSKSPTRSDPTPASMSDRREP